MTTKQLSFSVLFFSSFLFACSQSDSSKEKATKVYSGLYIFGPEMKTITDCRNGIEYWVTDSSSNLELSYSKFNFEKPYEPVYVELEGNLMESNALESQDFDSTLIVRKVLKITKEIPAGQCAE